MRAPAVPKSRQHRAPASEAEPAGVAERDRVLAATGARTLILDGNVRSRTQFGCPCLNCSASQIARP